MQIPVPHLEQKQQSDCLAACAAMVLAYLGETIDYGRLLTLLNISSYGAPRRNITRLARLGVEVVYREANVGILLDILRRGDPVIVFVDTGELSYWTEGTNHAVVVIGAEGDFVLINDPAVDEGARSVPIAEFELAWLNADYACAIIQHSLA
jgi:ABC-type bacteriocin/lantibiotic exporter with double-glycine peptidase domain